jgi:N-acetylmuramidase/Putative peptidoglycan binding domain
MRPAGRRAWQGNCETSARKENTMTEFADRGRPLSEDALREASRTLDVGAPGIWAVLRVETNGCGFLPDRRPAILFERHVFHARTGGRFDAAHPDLSDRTRGEYGPGGAHQYERLERAIALDRPAALSSASWGLGQVMGYHAPDLGYADVEDMVRQMVASEDGQLQAMFRFVAKNRLVKHLQAKDWASFARGYNGAAFAQNAYDTKLASAFADFSQHGTPDVRVRSAQVFLTYQRLDPGPVDGVMGGRTRGALLRFQQQRGLAETGEVDDPTLAALSES